MFKWFISQERGSFRQVGASSFAEYLQQKINNEEKKKSELQSKLNPAMRPLASSKPSPHFVSAESHLGEQLLEHDIGEEEEDRVDM